MQFKESVLRKCRESAEMKMRFFNANAGTIETVCRRVAAALDSGRSLYVMGNGGSSCDAAHVAVEFVHPIIEKRRSFPAFALAGDTALLTAIGNDADFSQIFAEQLKLFAKPGDIALGISTSGMSSNVNYALQAAREMGMLTIGFSGKDGGRTKNIARILSNGTVFQYPPHSGSAYNAASRTLGHGSRHVGRRGHHLMERDFVLTCPVPITERKSIVMGHGSGGKLTAQLVHDLFLPAFDNQYLNKLDDQAVFQAGRRDWLLRPTPLS